MLATVEGGHLFGQLSDWQPVEAEAQTGKEAACKQHSQFLPSQVNSVPLRCLCHLISSFSQGPVFWNLLSPSDWSVLSKHKCGCLGAVRKSSVLGSAVFTLVGLIHGMWQLMSKVQSWSLCS